MVISKIKTYGMITKNSFILEYPSPFLYLSLGAIR